jgi:hypothetical protein
MAIYIVIAALALFSILAGLYAAARARAAERKMDDLLDSFDTLAVLVLTGRECADDPPGPHGHRWPRVSPPAPASGPQPRR